MIIELMVLNPKTVPRSTNKIVWWIKVDLEKVNLKLVIDSEYDFFFFLEL